MMAKARQRRQLQTTRKKLKRNIDDKASRNKRWDAADAEEREDLDYDAMQPVMPRSERDRRLEVERAAFSQGATPDAEDTTPDRVVAGRQGRVVAVAGMTCQVEVEQDTFQCRVRGSLRSEQSVYTNPVAVGDEVIVGDDDHGSGVVEQVLPRRSQLARPDVFYPHRQQLIVANADQLLIVSSWRDPIIWLELIDRYLIAAQYSKLAPVICINKIDLADDRDESELRLQPHKALGHRVVVTSALTGEGIDELRDALKDQTTVLTGLSGTGKSSLLSAVQPELDLRISDVSTYSGEGQHTTTQAARYKLDIGGFVVDTPGIREFGLAGLRKADLAEYFPEIESARAYCKFNNCLHINEPDCSVLEGRAQGVIPESRYHSYEVILKSLPD